MRQFVSVELFRDTSRCGHAGLVEPVWADVRQRDSESVAFIIGHIRNGAGTWTRCLSALMARRTIYGVLWITKGRCLKFLPRNGGIARQR